MLPKNVEYTMIILDMVDTTLELHVALENSQTLFQGRGMKDKKYQCKNGASTS